MRLPGLYWIIPWSKLCFFVYVDAVLNRKICRTSYRLSCLWVQHTGVSQLYCVILAWIRSKRGSLLGQTRMRCGGVGLTDCSFLRIRVRGLPLRTRRREVVTGTILLHLQEVLLSVTPYLQTKTVNGSNLSKWTILNSKEMERPSTHRGRQL